jgi:thiamine biosynthesis protein ThiS
MMKERDIQICLNGKSHRIPRETNIIQLIDFFKHHDEYLIVERNGRFVFPQDYKTTVLLAGDRVELIHPDLGG